jgi:hypothetical protein
MGRLNHGLSRLRELMLHRPAALCPHGAAYEPIDGRDFVRPLVGRRVRCGDHVRPEPAQTRSGHDAGGPRGRALLATLASSPTNDLAAGPARMDEDHPRGVSQAKGRLPRTAPCAQHRITVHTAGAQQSATDPCRGGSTALAAQAPGVSEVGVVDDHVRQGTGIDLRQIDRLRRVVSVLV